MVHTVGWLERLVQNQRIQGGLLAGQAAGRGEAQIAVVECEVVLRSQLVDGRCRRFLKRIARHRDGRERIVTHWRALGAEKKTP